MKFSIIVPVYNVEQYIEKCLQSINDQTYSNFEVIIVNDGSPDASENVILEFIKKIQNLNITKKKTEGYQMREIMGYDSLQEITYYLLIVMITLINNY